MLTFKDNLKAQKPYLKIAVIVLIAAVLLIPGLFYLSGYLSNNTPAIGNILYGVIFTAVLTITICSANIATFLVLRKKYSHHKGYLKWMFLEVLLTTLNAIVITAMVIFVAFLFSGSYPAEDGGIAYIYFNNILISVVVNLIVMGFVEAYTLFVRWKNAILETEKLLREKSDARYSALKNQVNPHFLFNSLNSLSSLIRTSPEKAIEFVDKFSKIYRYVLDSGEVMLIELREEINFINSFIFLQKIRFGENLKVNIEIPSQCMNLYIPPLSIQLLLENAIKHNEISTEFPFEVFIYIEENFLIVKNPVRLKKTLEKSTGIGLKNLQERYKHFSEKPTSFSVVNNDFIAKLPLLSENEI